MMLHRIAATHGLAFCLSFAALTLVASSGTASACACCETYAVVNVANWDRLNVRSGPGVEFSIIGSLEPDQGCIVLTGERVGNWVRLSDGGWVNARYLQYRHDG